MEGKGNMSSSTNDSGEIVVGSKVWAEHLNGKKRRGIVRELRGHKILCYSETTHEKWEAPLATAVPVIDSAKMGSESAKLQKKMLSDARDHLRRARALAQGVDLVDHEDVEPPKKKEK